MVVTFLMKQNLLKKQCQMIVYGLVFVIALPISATDNNNGLDPTKPLFGAKQGQMVKVCNNLILTGIFHGSHGGNTHTVIINGQSLKVNDSIGEYRLVAVNDDSVILRSSEKRLKLFVFSGVVKKASH